MSASEAEALGWDDEWRVELVLPADASGSGGRSEEKEEVVYLHLVRGSLLPPHAPPPPFPPLRQSADLPPPPHPPNPHRRALGLTRRQAPTPDLLHPSAQHRSSALGPPRPLARSTLLAYSGFVLPPSLSDLHWHTAAAAAAADDAHPSSSSAAAADDDGPRRRRALEAPEGALGWARVVVGDPAKASFQGAFTVRGETWHVLPHRTFALHADDADAADADRLGPAARSSRSPVEGRSDETVVDPDALVLFRDGSVRRPAGAALDGGGGGCALDSLSFNTDRAHPVHRAGRRRAGVREGGGRPAAAAAWAEPWGGTEGGWFGKRQDAGGSLGSNLESVLPSLPRSPPPPPPSPRSPSLSPFLPPSTPLSPLSSSPRV